MTWLFSRLGYCRVMQRLIDRVKDAREDSCFAKFQGKEGGSQEQPEATLKPKG